MKQPESRKRGGEPRRIIGLSLPPALAADVKMEAKRRGLTVRKLFMEVWAIYRAKKP